MSERKVVYAAALLLLALGLAFALLAQTPPPAPPPAAPESGTAPAAVSSGDDSMLEEGESLYRHMGERDPFSPLVRGASAEGGLVKVNPGSAGLARFTVESCSLEAIIKTAQGTVAWFQGPDAKPYKAAAGERFADGVVISISYEDGEVVVQQELNDPTAIKPYRDLPLKIRSQEGEGQ